MEKISYIMSENDIQLMIESIVAELKKDEHVIHIMFVYNGNINATFTEIQSKIILILQRLKELNEQTAEQDSDSHSKVL